MPLKYMGCPNKRSDWTSDVYGVAHTRRSVHTNEYFVRKNSKNVVKEVSFNVKIWLLGRSKTFVSLAFTFLFI